MLLSKAQSFAADGEVLSCSIEGYSHQRYGVILLRNSSVDVIIGITRGQSQLAGWLTPHLQRYPSKLATALKGPLNYHSFAC